MFTTLVIHLQYTRNTLAIHWQYTRGTLWDDQNSAILGSKAPGSSLNHDFLSDLLAFQAIDTRAFKSL
jgi:hypothetical protein